LPKSVRVRPNPWIFSCCVSSSSMKSLTGMFAICAFALFSSAAAAETKTNPLLKVLELLSDFETRLLADEETEAKVMRKYSTYCKDMAVENTFEDQTLTTQCDKLKATIESVTATIDTSDAKIAELAATIASATDKLTKATDMRKMESEDFKAKEAEFLEVIDTLGRASDVLEKEMSKGSSFAQIQSSLSTALASLGTVVDALGLSAGDKEDLMALVQTADADEEDELSAPTAAAYDSHSSGILETIANMKDKAETSLADTREQESQSQHNYDMLKQALEDALKADNKNLADVKSEKGAAQEDSATAEGELQVSQADLESVRNKRNVVNTRCMQGAADHDKTVAGRRVEIATIQKATKVLQETTGGAASQSYSLMQVGAESSAKFDGFSKAPAMIRRLAKRHHSAALAQLASQVSAVLRLSSGSSDGPFAKVKGLIEQLMAKLEAEAASESKEKAFCDSEMAKTNEKKEELDEELEKLTTKIDVDAAASANLKSEVQELTEAIHSLQTEQKDANDVRASYHAEYLTATADFEQGLQGVRQALGVLRDYYAKESEGAALVQDDDKQFDSFMQQPSPPQGHDAGSGTGASIIGLLEVMESDFATGLTEAETQENMYQDLHDKASFEREKAKAIKEADITYKTKEFKSLDKNLADLSSDRDTSSQEQAAVLEYYAKLSERCIAKPETYEETKKRRQAEIAGLKEALSALEGEVALLQRRKRSHHALRGAQLSTDAE